MKPELLTIGNDGSLTGVAPPQRKLDACMRSHRMPAPFFVRVSPCVPLEKYFAPLSPGLVQYAADHLGDPAICRMTTPHAAAGVGLMRHMTVKEHRGMWADYIDGARELYTLSFEAAEGCYAHVTPVLAKAIHRARLRLQKLLMPLDGGARKNAELSNRAAVAVREMSFALRKADRTYLATRAWELFETWDEIRNALGVAPPGAFRCLQFSSDVACR